MNYMGGLTGNGHYVAAGRKGAYVRSYLQKTPSWSRKDFLITSGGPSSRLRNRLSSAKSVDLQYNKTCPAQLLHHQVADDESPPPEENHSIIVNNPVVVAPHNNNNNTEPTTTLSKTYPRSILKKTVCDKCDGPHLTERCPVYLKPREDHPDALRRRPANMGRPCGNVVITSARVVRQPGDGSCLFHSLSHGMSTIGLRQHPARVLRREICKWLTAHPTQPIAETPLSDWVLWDTRLSPAAYAHRMSGSEWGGGIEMACFSIMYNAPVQVWEANKLGPGYRRISCFDPLSVKPDSDLPHASCVNVLYQGGVHYDALVT